MDLDDLIRTAVEDPPARSDVERVAAEMHLTPSGVLDAIARAIAERYCRGDCSWDFGDAVMNHLRDYGYNVTEEGLPDFTTLVFEAFDEGEYTHLSEPGGPEGEQRTRLHLSRLMGGCGA